MYFVYLGNQFEEILFDAGIGAHEVLVEQAQTHLLHHVTSALLQINV